MLGFLTAMQLLLTVKVPALMTKFMMFLTGTETVTENASGLDVGIVSEVMDIVVTVVTSFVGLFKLWPLNLFLILGIIGFAVSFFFKGKRGVRR